MIASLHFVHIPMPSARSETERQAAIANIRACLGKPDLAIEYKSTVRSADKYDVVSEIYVSGGDYIEVDRRTNQVIQIGPASQSKAYDTTARYTPAQLETMARAFIARCAGNVHLDTLTANHGNKGGVNYFFRWEDNNRSLDFGMHPFIQVGLTRGGDLLGYVNTLRLVSAP